MLHLENLVT